MPGNKEVMARFYEAINRGEMGVVEEVVAEDVVEHDPMVTGSGRDGVRQFFEMARAGFPDMRMEVTHMVGEGDLAMAHGLFEGTHDGDFMGIAATHRHISVPFADVVRFREGMAVEHWGVMDGAAMMEQLGVGSAAPG